MSVDATSNVQAPITQAVAPKEAAPAAVEAAPAVETAAIAAKTDAPVGIASTPETTAPELGKKIIRYCIIKTKQ